jgi:D-alanyl-D-alanine carboxypeptidase (penicillin-binding protein 5/6)
MNLDLSRRLFLARSAAATSALIGLPALLAPGKFLWSQELLPKKQADRLDGPPLVSAKGWAIVEGKTGKFLWGDHQHDQLVMASTTKIMTAWLVLDLARTRPDILKETVIVSETAAKTTGSSAKIQTGDRYPVLDLLYGLLLPSGNDAATAFAEHCGEYYRQEGDGASSAEAFVAQMNRQAQEWKLFETKYFDPHGLGKNHTSTANLATIAWHAMQNETFRQIAQTRRREYEVTNDKDEKRMTVWNNTNKLLEIEGYDGIKTGTTTAAGSCLVSSGRRGDDHLIIAVLGSTTSENRYLDTRNLYRWAWRERGHKAD